MDAGLAANSAVTAEVGIASYPELHVYPARDGNKMLELALALVREKLRRPESEWLLNAF